MLKLWADCRFFLLYLYPVELHHRSVLSVPHHRGLNHLPESCFLFRQNTFSPVFVPSRHPVLHCWILAVSILYFLVIQIHATVSHLPLGDEDAPECVEAHWGSVACLTQSTLQVEHGYTRAEELWDVMQQQQPVPQGHDGDLLQVVVLHGHLQHTTQTVRLTAWTAVKGLRATLFWWGFCLQSFTAIYWNMWTDNSFSIIQRIKLSFPSCWIQSSTCAGSLPALVGLLVDQARVWAEPHATLLIFLPCSAATSRGLWMALVVPSPSWPSSLSPHVYTSPEPNTTAKLSVKSNPT